ncbi:MAG: hypothetical protein Q9170_008325 [Blastenia crenularia]
MTLAVNWYTKFLSIYKSWKTSIVLYLFFLSPRPKSLPRARINPKKEQHQHLAQQQQLAIQQVANLEGIRPSQAATQPQAESPSRIPRGQLPQVPPITPQHTIIQQYQQQAQAAQRSQQHIQQSPTHVAGLEAPEQQDDSFYTVASNSFDQDETPIKPRTALPRLEVDDVSEFVVDLDTYFKQASMPQPTGGERRDRARDFDYRGSAVTPIPTHGIRYNGTPFLTYSTPAPKMLARGRIGETPKPLISTLAEAKTRPTTQRDNGVERQDISSLISFSPATDNLAGNEGDASCHGPEISSSLMVVCKDVHGYARELTESRIGTYHLRQKTMAGRQSSTAERQISAAGAAMQSTAGGRPGLRALDRPDVTVLAVSSIGL